MSSRSRAVIKDKWKLKKWYTAVAPKIFGEVSLGDIPADDPDKLIGRVVETTLYDLTGDITQVHFKLYFQVIEVQEDKAITRFRGHELARDYMKSLIRRKSSKVQAIVDVQTSDGYVLRVTGVVLTSYRCKTSQRRAIRKAMIEHLKKRASETTFEQFINAVVSYQLANEIAELARKIYPVRRVEIYKTKLLKVPGPNGPEPAVVISPIQLKKAA